MAGLQLNAIPWRKVRSWGCVGCGDICCNSFRVPISAWEWARLCHLYGPQIAEFRFDGLYLKKRADGSCIFLYPSMGNFLCALQAMKPYACKLWPFKIGRKPTYGCADEALYSFKGDKFYVYLDPFCRGIMLGKPTQQFAVQVIPEFIEIFLGGRRAQIYSTMPSQGFTHPQLRPELQSPIRRLSCELNL
ncbi:MAG: YkgJ family cysteine cluster protein [Candidatus Bathyarchaeia archaeon]